VTLIRKVLDLLSPRERRQALLLLGLIIVMAFLDMIGVASIMPFMAVLATPDLVRSNRYLAAAYDFFGFSDRDSFMFFLGVAVFITLVLSISFKALTAWAMLRFSRLREYSLTKRVVELYLHQPYEWFLNKHSSDLGKTVLAEVGQVVGGAILPMMELIAQGCVVVALLSLLIVADPVLACVGGLGMGLAYGAIYAFLRRRVSRFGEQRRESNRLRFETLAEAFGGIKEVKVGGLESRFVERFERPAYDFALAQGSAQAASQLPRFGMEILAFGGILAVVLYLMRNSGGLQGALPVVALYALAGYRLMPALQSLYVNFTALRFIGPTLDHLHRELVTLPPPPVRREAPVPMRLMQDVVLENIVYQYPRAARPSLNDLCIRIPARSTVGLVGATGSGKTTMVDIILGLLQQQSGRLLVDGVEISGENRRNWQSSIGYVPQNIFLADDSVAANIAFGVAEQHIDQAAVERAARIANLHDFVVGGLPDGYRTSVGERGVRLSGGQRQRIGIARALYHRPQLLILDEATSALDNLTEQVVMDAVHNLGHEITIILIAHRLTTVRECDRIFLLDNGRVAAAGNFRELVDSNEVFRSMTLAADETA
jgi:ABC-type multidrug transport system fused ATPase/permease subunit